MQIEKNEVLVWLDFGPYAYINFGIIAELSKLDKFDFIGIVTTRQDLSFFQNQKIISFKELIYYPDCYINKSTCDLQNLKKFEERFELNLWLDALNDRSIYKYWTYFHKFTRNEILSIVENSIDFFVNTLEKVKPKLVLMQQPGENVSNLLLYRIAKKMQINVLTHNLTYMHNKITMSNDINCREISEEFTRLMSISNSSSKIYDDKFLKTNSFARSMDIISSFDYGRMSIFQRLKHYTKRISNNPEPIYSNVGKTKFKMLKYKVYIYFELKKRKKFLDNNSIKTINNEKFLYYPLQSEPESLVTLKSPLINQIVLIENIAKSIPIDLVLYVKEHPIQKEKLWRPIEFYQKIIDIPNVKLIHPSLDSKQLIAESQGVVCLSGATGFEALFYKKPVILFANEYYDVISTIKKADKITELSSIINQALSDLQFNNTELEALIQATENKSLSVPYYSMMKDALVLSSIQRNGSFDVTIANFQKYQSTFKEYFTLMAKTIYSKI